MCQPANTRMVGAWPWPTKPELVIGADTRVSLGAGGKWRGVWVWVPTQITLSDADDDLPPDAAALI